MFRHLLVPLDGSKVAEGVLPAVAALARHLNARTTLLHVIERDPPKAVHGDAHITDGAEADAYLAGCAKRAFSESAVVTRHVHAKAESNVAQSIAAHAVELEADLIVLCTHGRAGLRHRLFGSVAQAVAGAGAGPVLLIPPEGSGREWWPVRHILVAVDGRPEHAQPIPVAVGCATACSAALRVLWVVPTLGTLPPQHAASGQRLPSTTAALLELETEEAATAARAELNGAGARELDASVTVARGDPTKEIRKAADAFSADLVILGTHGRSGFDAVAAGSVAPRLAGRATWPVLLVPIGRAPG
jgi:nucleotide-binding universal stress UspA family protein